MTGRSHPMTIFFSLGRVLYLIVIPVLRGLITGTAVAWTDMLVLLFMLAFAFFSRLCTTYEYNDECLIVRKGIFFSQRAAIPWEHICTLSGTSAFFLRPFRASILRGDTIAGDKRRHDIDICLHVDTANEILAFHRRVLLASATPECAKRMCREYVPGIRSIAAYAFLNSNTFAGIVFLSAFISQTGRLLGEEFSGLLIGSFEELSRHSALDAIGLPPIAAAIALALLLGWLIAFTLTIIRYHGLRVREDCGQFFVTGGFFTQRKYTVNKELVSFVDMRQTVVSMFLKIRSLYICAPGYAVRKDDIACLIPTRRSEPPASRRLKPCPRGKLGYLLPPLCFCIGVVAFAALLFVCFPAFRDLILFMSLMLLAPSLLFFLVRWIDFRTGGLSLDDAGGCTLRYSRGFRLHCVIIPGDKIALAKVSRNIFQRRRGRCNLIICSISIKRKAHICRNMVYDEIMRLPILDNGGQTMLY